jgi:hypothetical protein
MSYNYITLALTALDPPGKHGAEILSSLVFLPEAIEVAARI